MGFDFVNGVLKKNAQIRAEWQRKNTTPAAVEKGRRVSGVVSFQKMLDTELLKRKQQHPARRKSAKRSASVGEMIYANVKGCKAYLDN